MTPIRTRHIVQSGAHCMIKDHAVLVATWPLTILLCPTLHCRHLSWTCAVSMALHTSSQHWWYLCQSIPTHKPYRQAVCAVYIVLNVSMQPCFSSHAECFNAAILSFTSSRHLQKNLAARLLQSDMQSASAAPLPVH